MSTVLAFEIAGHRFALPVPAVCEVVRAAAVTSLPGAPAVVEGVLDVRGELAAVLDLRGRFGFPPSPISPTDFMIVARAGRRLVVLRVDRVTGVLELPPGAVEPTETITVPVPAIGGVARLPDGLALVHDLETFLTDSEAAGLDALTRARDGSA